MSHSPPLKRRRIEIPSMNQVWENFLILENPFHHSIVHSDQALDSWMFTAAIGHDGYSLTEFMSVSRNYEIGKRLWRNSMTKSIEGYDSYIQKISKEDTKEDVPKEWKEKLITFKRNNKVKLYIHTEYSDGFQDSHERDIYEEKQEKLREKEKHLKSV